MIRWLLFLTAFIGLNCGPIEQRTCDPTEGDQAKISAAIDNQQSGHYDPDAWRCQWLKQGDLVYGGIPGQTPYYTTRNTLDASGNNAPRLWESLQVAPHKTFGYRVQVMEYQVLADIRVPYGKCRDNPQYGDGGGEQYFIADFATALKATGNVTKLTDGGSENLSKVKPTIKKLVGIAE